MSSFRRVSTKNATSIARHLVDASVIEITDMGKMRTEKRLVVINHHPGRCIRCHTCFGARWNPGVLPLGKCFWQISLKRCLYVKSWRKRTTFFLFWSRVGPPEHRIVPLRPYLGHFEARNWHIGHKWLQLLQMGWTLVKMGWAPEMTNSGPKLPYWP